MPVSHADGTRMTVVSGARMAGEAACAVERAAAPPRETRRPRRPSGIPATIAVRRTSNERALQPRGPDHSLDPPVNP